MFKILFQIVLIMSAIGSIFWIAISILQPITERFFSCRWQYNMRLISIVFLILPVGILGGKILSEYELPKIQSSFNISNDSNNQHSNSEYSHPDDIDFYKYAIEDYSTDIVHRNALGDIISILPYIWIVGIFILGMYRTAMWIEFKRKLNSTSSYIDNTNILNIFKQCQFDIWVKNVSLMYNEMIDTPMTVGIFKPKLLIPEIELTDEELKIIFLHELIHCKRKDLYFKLIAMLANIIHWFNPIVYFIVKDMEQFCEISCDEEVVKDMNEQKRHFYGETILNVLSRAVNKSNSVHVTLCENKKGIERRLTFMLKSKNVPKKFTAISTALALILSLSGFTASSIVHSTTLNEIYKNDSIEQPKFQNVNLNSDSKSYSSKNYLKSIERGKISELYLNASEANVTILKSNDSKFNFEYDPNMDVNIYTENPYKLKLDIKTKDYSNLSFKMYIPEMEFDKFSIESSESFISIPNIEGNLDISMYDSKLTFKDSLLNSNMDLYSDSSSVYIKSDTIDSSFNIELEDSSATLNSQNINSKLSISSDSSSVYVSSDSINSEMDIDSDSDSMTVIVDNFNSGLNIDADSSSLKLKTKYINSNFEIENDSGNLNLNTDTINSNVNLNCDNSYVVVKLNKNPSNLKLNISDCEYAILPDGWSEKYSVGNGRNQLNIKDANDVRIYVDGVKSDKIIENNLYYNSSYGYIGGNDIKWDGVKNLDDASKEECKSANKVSHINSMDGQSISQIFVDIDKCGLIVKKSDNNEFSFDFVGFNDESIVDFKTEVVDNKLIVNAVRHKTGNIITSTADENVVNCISMKIPEKLYERFDVTGNGAVRLPNIQGSIYVSDTSGSVAIADTEITSNIYVEGSSGSVKVEADSLNSPLYVNSSSGSLKLNIKNINAAVNLKASGSTLVSVENINSDINIASSGSMKLEFRKQPMNLKLDATRCGNINLPDGWSKNYIVGNGIPKVTIQSSGSSKIIIK